MARGRLAELEIDGGIDYTRGRDWFDPTEVDTRVTVIGAGGIGSSTVLFLSKLGISEITLYDDDLVEAHNLPNQLFPLGKLGFSKVDALAEVARTFGVSKLITKQQRWSAEDREEKLRGLVISGVDSMEARKEIWKGIKGNFLVPRYWDARLGGEKVVIYSVNPRSQRECELYEKTLYSDEEAQPDPCTRRAVIDVMGIVSSHLVRGIRRQFSGEAVEGFIYHHQGELKIYSGTLAMAVGEDG